VSWNVAGFAAALKKGFREYMEKEKPDIICLQETKINPTKVTDKDAPAGYERYFIASETAGQDGTGYAGDLEHCHSCFLYLISFLSSIFTRIKPLNVTYGIGVKEHDQEGRVITLEFDKFYVINCYVPNSGMKLQHLEYRMKWDEDFRTFMKGLDAKKPIIWCGDLNVAHLDIDLKNPKTNKKSPGFQPQERESFSKTLGTGFVDTYRKHHPTETDCYTFWSYKRESRSKDIGWRLDYFVISERFVDQVKTIYRRKYVMGSEYVHFRSVWIPVPARI
jgi:exodeoxyribonuclease III